MFRSLDSTASMLLGVSRLALAIVVEIANVQSSDLALYTFRAGNSLVPNLKTSTKEDSKMTQGGPFAVVARPKEGDMEIHEVPDPVGPDFKPTPK